MRKKERERKKKKKKEIEKCQNISMKKHLNVKYFIVLYNPQKDMFFNTCLLYNFTYEYFNVVVFNNDHSNNNDYYNNDNLL